VRTYIVGGRPGARAANIGDGAAGRGDDT